MSKLKYICLERHGHRSDDALLCEVLREEGDDAVVVLLAQVDVNLLQHARHFDIRWIRLLHHTDLLPECPITGPDSSGILHIF